MWNGIGTDRRCSGFRIAVPSRLTRMFIVCMQTLTPVLSRALPDFGGFVLLARSAIEGFSIHKPGLRGMLFESAGSGDIS
jgi:hypothetical protein